MTQLRALEKKRPADDQTNWATAFFMAAFHIGAVAALFFFTWKAVFIAIFLWWVSGSFGIGMGYHRLLTHRGWAGFLQEDPCTTTQPRWPATSPTSLKISHIIQE